MHFCNNHTFILNFHLIMLQVNIFNTTTTNSPKADGLNAMQSWVICCIFFVFGALFEYAIILLQMKIKTFRKLAASMQKDETCAMDVAVLIAFPIVFLIFNIVYWAAFHLWTLKQTKNFYFSCARRTYGSISDLFILCTGCGSKFLHHLNFRAKSEIWVLVKNWLTYSLFTHGK